MSLRTIMNSIGNAFKTGWNNGNIQKGMQVAGATAFGVGAIGAMAHEMKNGSIFGGCCHGGYGMNPFGMSMGMSPYGMSGFGMGMSPYGMMGAGNMFDSMGMLNNYSMMGTNPCLTSAGQQWAFEWGRNLAMQQSMNPAFSSNFNMYSELTDEQIDKLAPTRDNKKVIGNANADTKLGDEFEGGTDKLLKDKKDAEPVKLSETKFTNDNKTEYVSNLSKVAESYIAKIGSNGTISEDDYIDHEIEKYKEDNPNRELTENDEAYLRNQMKLAFAKLDLNRDGEIDKNEMTSALATFDTGGNAIGTSNSADGKITASEYSAAQSSLTANNKTFATNNWNNYQQLFGVQKKSEE